jgi:hypothetical protein
LPSLVRAILRVIIGSWLLPRWRLTLLAGVLCSLARCFERSGSIHKLGARFRLHDALWRLAEDRFFKAPGRRIAQLAMAQPHTITSIVIVPGSRHDEQTALFVLRKTRTNREWF